MTSSSLPPVDLSKSVVVICNGEMEITPAIVERIKRSATVIGVDGGLNHCHRMHIKPQWAVGDFDSVEPNVLKETTDTIGFTKLARAKDETDLEVAIAKAREVSEHAQIIIFGGLGGRIDHTLGNIYLLLRNPGKVFLESENQVLFAINPSLGKIKISDPHCKTLSLFPLHGAAREVVIEKDEGVTRYPTLDKAHPLAISTPNNCLLSVAEGDVIVCLDKRDIKNRPHLPLRDLESDYVRCYLNADFADVMTCLERKKSAGLQLTTPLTDFSLKRPLIAVFDELRDQSTHSPDVPLSSKNETVYNIRSSSGKVSFPCQRGQTISLIPFYGPASGITTNGLKWELGKDTINRLDKSFVGVSNVCTGNTFSVEVTEGELLCIINHKVIDIEMVNAQIIPKPNTTQPSQQNGETMAAPVKQSSQPSVWEKYLEASLVGAGRGLIGLPVEHPFDVVKTRMQANLDVRSVRAATKEIISTMGVRGFYTGAIPNGIRLAVKQVYRYPMMLAFPVYYREHIPASIQKASPAAADVATGLTIASLESAIINPLERLKIALITSLRKGKTITEFYREYKGKIVPESMRGLRAQYPRQIMTWVSFLVADTKAKNWERKNTGKQQLSFYSLMKVAAIVGTVNTVCNLPFDVVKTRLQMEQYETGGVFKTMRKIAQTHGIRGLYAGWPVRMVQYMIQSAFTVTVLDGLQAKFQKK